jgi:hypothetical protein
MRRRSNRFGLFVGTSLAIIAARGARAQDVGSAETMFDRGVNDMEAGRLDAACPEIAESLRLDPRPGTLFTLAECYAKAGKTASAVARYQDYLEQFAKMTPDQQAKQEDRPQVAQHQIALLAPTIPTLTLRLAPGAPAGTEVKRDGVALGTPSLGVALPVDPGQHTVTVGAPGGPASTQTFALGPAQRKELVLTVAPGGAATVGSGNVVLAPGEDPRRGTAQRIAGFVIGGVGTAGLAVGAVAGGITLAKRSSAQATCNFTTKQCTDDQGLATVSAAHTMGIVSTVGFVTGGVLLGTGIIVVVTAPHPRTANVRAAMTIGPGRLSLSGSF